MRSRQFFTIYSFFPKGDQSTRIITHMTCLAGSGSLALASKSPLAELRLHQLVRFVRQAIGKKLAKLL